jgi:TetR/AcrR family transcriptional repressor of nem operon
MRSKSDKKRNTHDRIVSGAARLFRGQGYSASGVDSVMAAAGLTAGGFYSHFKNKDALLAEALLLSFSGMPMPAEVGYPVPDESSHPLENWVQRYASELHRDHPAVGCSIPTLAAEVARQGPEVRAAFTEALLERVNALADKLGRRSHENVDAAIVAIAAAAGAILLARAVNDPELSTRVLRAVRDTYRYQKEE